MSSTSFEFPLWYELFLPKNHDTVTDDEMCFLPFRSLPPSQALAYSSSRATALNTNGNFNDADMHPHDGREAVLTIFPLGLTFKAAFLYQGIRVCTSVMVLEHSEGMEKDRKTRLRWKI